MRRTDIQAIGELAGEALAAGGGLIKGMHEGIASRPFEVLGPPAAPVRVIHDDIAHAVYGGVRGAVRAASRATATVLALEAGDDGPAPAATPAGSVALGALNGVYGNHLVQRANRLALEMEVRRLRTWILRPRPIRFNRPIRSTFPLPSGRALGSSLVDTD